MNPGWKISSNNFREDDGSLPGIEFRELHDESVHALTEYFFSHGEIHTSKPTARLIHSEEDVPLQELIEPAKELLGGRIHPFHCCFSGISHEGYAIPVIGLFVFKDAVEIDYRMGAEWTPESVDSFFKLLAYLKSLAPEAIIDSTQSEGLPWPDEFKAALDHYLT